MDEHEIATARHKAVLTAVAGYSHIPPKPDDMSDEFYNIAMDFWQECISFGRRNIANAVLGYIADGGANNIEQAGHRLALLSPGVIKFGVGYASDSYSSIAVHLDGDWNDPESFGSNSFIAWPNAGDFPIQYFNIDKNLSCKPPYPWSLHLGFASGYDFPSKDDITLKLTRARDNKV